MQTKNRVATEKKFIIPEGTDYSDESIHKLADEIMREDDRITRWKKIHKLMRKQNKKARKEQDETAKDCKSVREEGIFLKTKSKKLGLRFGVSLPPMTYNAIVQTDRHIFGSCDLSETNKEEYLSRDATNAIVKDLEKAFPQYKVS